MPLEMNFDHPEARKVLNDIKWNRVLKAHETGGDEAFDKAWAEEYGVDTPKTAKPPVKEKGK